MRVSVVVESGAKAGYRFALGAGEKLKIGRTEWADVVFSGDRFMSGVHFRIETDRSVCYLEDEGSTHGTLVNDEPVKRVVLRSGDRIRAGNTTFLVSLEGISAADLVGVPMESAPREEAKCEAPATFWSEQGRSRVNCYRGQVVEMPSVRLVKKLTELYRVTLLLDPGKLPGKVAETLDSGEYLFDWIPAEIRRGNSPLLLTEEVHFGDLSIVHHGWGKDTLIIVFSEKGVAPPLAQLRRCAGVFARPAFLRPQLMETAAEQARDFLLEIEAVLVEGESPEEWRIYSTSDMGAQLEAIGLRRTTPGESMESGK